jgi:eukaryotic-like serine/threonine-protein kinase
MTPERWQEIRAVLERADVLGDSERAEYLNQACACDDELRIEVESLLEVAVRAGGEFLNTPAADLMQSAGEAELRSSRIAWSGRRIGAYQIVAEIGHGGMGEVYRAVRTDGEFDQQVAIKLVRTEMGSSFIMQRFLYERQILASLSHPHIARLLDGGSTDDGVPYLVMEIIDGERIDTYCEGEKLSVSGRLRLFLKVCEAIQYAHQRLIVHRDIKPSNILVTKDGVPKLLDFGIAKMLDPSADTVTTIARPMTPEYASPEQIRGESITTATDVYSLGVVLYLLLTGRSPYKVGARTPHDWSRAIVETQPSRPSNMVISTERIGQSRVSPVKPVSTIFSNREPTPAKLRRRLAGDIDNIVLKALRKEPELRYGSVQQFADDISRHINGLPVTAAKGSWAYFARKFMARHRTGLAATSIVILALTAGILATEKQARIAGMERGRAQKRFNDVRQFSNALIFDVHDSLLAVPGTTAARNLLLDRAVKYLDGVSKDAEGDSDLQRELAKGYQRLATVQGDASVSNVGQVSAADLSLEKAMHLFESVAATSSSNVTDQLNLAMIYRQQGISDIYYPNGRPQLEKAIAITDRLMRSNGTNSKVRIERAVEYQGMGMSLDIMGYRMRAMDWLRNALTLVEATVREDPHYRNLAARKAKLLVELGTEYAYAGEMQRARELTREGVVAYQALVDKGAEPDTVRDLAGSRQRLGEIELILNDASAARKNFRLVREALAPLAKSDPDNMEFQSDLLGLHFEEARLFVLEGNFKEGAPQLQQLITRYQGLPSDEDVGPGFGVLFTWLGEAQFGAGNYAQALQSFQQAAKTIEGGVQYDDARTGLVTVYVRIGDTLLELHRPAEAEKAYETARKKSDLSFAYDQRDMPAIYSSAAVSSALAAFQMKLSYMARSSEERLLRRNQACGAFEESQKTEQHLTSRIRFTPSEFPVILSNGFRNYTRHCGSADARFGNEWIAESSN